MCSLIVNIELYVCIVGEAMFLKCFCDMGVVIYNTSQQCSSESIVNNTPHDVVMATNIHAAWHVVFFQLKKIHTEPERPYCVLYRAPERPNCVAVCAAAHQNAQTVCLKVHQKAAAHQSAHTMCYRKPECYRASKHPYYVLLAGNRRSRIIPDCDQ